MRDVRLPDGTWVTTPIAAGPAGPACAACRFVDAGPVVEEGGVRVQLQRCAACGSVRGRYLDNPHPEVTDDGGTD